MVEDKNPKGPVKYIHMMCSPAHTYGNAVAFMQKWLIDRLPKKANGESIFKTINVSSKIAHRQIRKTSKEISKNGKPAFLIRPRIDFNEDRFLKGTPLTDTLILDKINYGPDGLMPFFFDYKKQVSIKYQMNRAVMYFDVILLFSTYMEKINVATYIKNKFPLDGRVFDINAPLESFLPIELMEMVSEIADVPLYTDNSVKPFLTYMNQHSNSPVTYKLQGSSGTMEFYRYYHAKMISSIQQFDPDGDGEKNNMVTDNYPINMTFRVEFYTPGFFYLFSNDVFKVRMPEFPDDTSIIPVFTDMILREDWDVNDGWMLYARFSCSLTQENDHVNFKTSLRPSVITAIEYYVNRGYYMGEIVDVRIREQGRFMNYGEEFDVNFKDFEVEFHNKEYGYFTYTVMILIKPEVINDLISELLNLK